MKGNSVAMDCYEFDFMNIEKKTCFGRKIKFHLTVAKFVRLEKAGNDWLEPMYLHSSLGVSESLHYNHDSFVRRLVSIV